MMGTWDNTGTTTFTREGLQVLKDRLVSPERGKEQRELVKREAAAYEYLERVQKVAPELVSPLAYSWLMNGVFIVSSKVSAMLAEKGL